MSAVNADAIAGQVLALRAQNLAMQEQLDALLALLGAGAAEEGPPAKEKPRTFGRKEERA
jgi:hypothetical protein